VAKKARLNSRLESEGAEFLVLGTLLIEGIQCFKAYTNFAGYDLVAVNPASKKSSKKSVRIQVKSRWATDYNRTFPIKNYNCDFVVFVALNRGYRNRKKVSKSNVGRRSPQFYCFPVDVVKKVQNVNSSWGIIKLDKIPKLATYENNWAHVRKFIS
jgi:hypothetical protein